MTALFLLAHNDDEYCALPLILAARRAGEAIAVCYATGPDNEHARRRREAESLAFLAHFGAPDGVCRTQGLRLAPDGALKLHLGAVLAALERLLEATPITRIVCPAWEGGHLDHDLCAVLATTLAARRALAAPVLQFSLYQGQGLPGPLFHGARPLPGNGPVTRVRMSAADWWRFAAAVRFFPSQAAVWSTLWPAMFWSALRQGVGVQRLDPARICERPHPGPLLYERRGHGRYEEVAAMVGAFLAEANPGAVRPDPPGPGPRSAAAGRRRCGSR